MSLASSLRSSWCRSSSFFEHSPGRFFTELCMVCRVRVVDGKNNFEQKIQTIIANFCRLQAASRAKSPNWTSSWAILLNLPRSGPSRVSDAWSPWIYLDAQVAPIQPFWHLRRSLSVKLRIRKLLPVMKMVMVVILLSRMHGQQTSGHLVNFLATYIDQCKPPFIIIYLYTLVNLS